MTEDAEILPAGDLLPPELRDFRLPPGISFPENILLSEHEAAAFLREPVARLRGRRTDGTGPVFISAGDGNFDARYLVWDLLAWCCQHRRSEMPRVSRRDLRRAASADAA